MAYDRAMDTIEAVVEKGGVLHVPFPEGTPVKVQAKKFVEYTREEWVAFVRDFTGSIPEMEAPERGLSRPIPPLDEA